MKKGISLLASSLNHILNVSISIRQFPNSCKVAVDGSNNNFQKDKPLVIFSSFIHIREVSQHYGYGYLNGYVTDLSRHVVDFRD